MADALRDAFTKGQRWGEGSDLPQHRLRSYEAGDLALGQLEDGPVLGFNGNESLVTFGPPGRGKTQAHALLNLLNVPHPMVVLDLKGELFEASAGWRQAGYGARVLKFSLLGDGEPYHCFNPLLLLSRDPDRIWDDARAMAMDLVPSPPNEHDPFWTNSARDLVAVLLGSMLLGDEDDDDEDITFAELMARLALGGKERVTFLKAVVTRASAAGVAGLKNRAQSIIALKDSDRVLESVCQTARSALSCFESPIVQRATARSDWRPEDLRDGATTLYLLLPMDQIAPYAPLIRALVGAHFKQLTRKPPERGAPPVTFVMDELLQLGNFEAAVQVVEIGRSYGLRLWSFAQHVQRFQDAFARWKVLTDSPAVRCYMNPDLDTAEEISASIGTVQDMFTGRESDVASAAELMGANFADSIIVMQAGGHVFKARKLFAYEALGDRVGMIYRFRPDGQPPRMELTHEAE